MFDSIQLSGGLYCSFVPPFVNKLQHPSGVGLMSMLRRPNLSPVSPVLSIAIPPQIAIDPITPASRRVLPLGPSRSYRGPVSACYSRVAGDGTGNLSSTLEDDELSSLEPELELPDLLIDEPSSTSLLPSLAFAVLGCEPFPWGDILALHSNSNNSSREY